MADGHIPRIEIDKELLLQASSVLAMNGLAVSEAVHEFLRRIVAQGLLSAGSAEETVPRISLCTSEQKDPPAEPRPSRVKTDAAAIERLDDEVRLKCSLLELLSSMDAQGAQAVSAHHLACLGTVPDGYESWLEYAVCTFDVRPSLAHLILEDVYRDECNRVQIELHAELNALRAKAKLPALSPKGLVQIALEERSIYEGGTAHL